jgi:hypothetical protein
MTHVFKYNDTQQMERLFLLRLLSRIAQSVSKDSFSSIIMKGGKR